ncbi:hypothetical protein H0921_14460 [thermophilic bacterium 2918]|uniref:Uncharacterized protein n=1 Tax=Thermogemmata fonticola TaxID=2755323 RepID=A0A7V8VG06_9BACT|nr:hypothetical protein [Thermogemmata fonticola]
MDTSTASRRFHCTVQAASKKRLRQEGHTLVRRFSPSEGSKPRPGLSLLLVKGCQTRGRRLS